MKFKLIYQQEVKIEAKDEATAIEQMKNNVAFIEITGCGVKDGNYILNSGKFKIISCKEVKRF
jgi:hypothetical protein